MSNTPTLITLLMKVKDKRREAGKRHQLIHILLIIIIGTLSGYEGYRGLESFVKRFGEELIVILGIDRKQVPSMSTIRRVMMVIDFNQLSAAFYKWSKSRVKISKQEWIICDGKGIKGSISNTFNKQQNFVSLVSMYCSRAGVALFAVAMNNKEKSEIEALQELIVKVKANQKRLLDEMIDIKDKKKAKDSFTEEEVNRGRREKRMIRTFSASSSIKRQWAGARSVVYIERTTVRKGIETLTKSYYLSSLNLNTKKMMEGIRCHWTIENSLHYVKDVVIHEDASKIKNTNAVAVYALIRNMALTAYRIKGRASIKNAIRECGGNIDLLLKITE